METMVVIILVIEAISRWYLSLNPRQVDFLESNTHQLVLLRAEIVIEIT